MSDIHPHPAHHDPRPALADNLRPLPADNLRPLPADETGSLVTEYGLLALVAATIAGVVIKWASGGAIVTLFNDLLSTARKLVGA